MKLKKLLEKIDYTLLKGNEEIEVCDLGYDSRSISNGYAFVCLVGNNADGHNYIESAIENGAKTDDASVLKEGMELIHQKFGKILEGIGVKKIDTADADFNTDYHEAIAMVPGMGDDKKGKVLDCVQTGYTLNEKVIRHAKVAVGQ